MPSVKRKLTAFDRERSEIKKTNHSISSFFGKSKQSESSTPSAPTSNGMSSAATNTSETPTVVQSDIETPATQSNIDVTTAQSNIDVTTAQSNIDVTTDRSNSDTPSKKKSKHKIRFDQKWTVTRPWLFTKNETTEKGSAIVMYCRLCQQHNTQGFNGSATWNRTGCESLRLDKVVKHETSGMHKQALQLETEVQLGIQAAFKDRLPMGEKEFEAVVCATKMLHFLIKHNIPHTTIFKDFVNFAIEELKSPVLQHLSQGKNATYTSHRITEELTTAMAEDIESTIHKRVNASPGYAIMNDETTDVSNRKHLAFCVTYVEEDSGAICVDYLKDVRVDDGKAETIYKETKTVIEDLSLEKFVAFGSDGCNTMIGKKTGVTTRLKEMKKEIVTVHCHNHRLALAAKDSFKSIPAMNDTDDLLSHVFKYYKSSGNRTGSLERLKKMLDLKMSTIKQAAHTRWLSHLDAVTSLRDSYQAVIMDMEHAVESGSDKVRLGSGPSASGLVKKLKTYKTIHIVHFLCDALKPLTQLALTFERNDIDLSTVKPRMDSTINALNKLKEADGINMKRGNKLIVETRGEPTDQEVNSIRKAEHEFINNLTDNIKRRLQCSDIIDNMRVFDISAAESSCMYGDDEIEMLADHFSMDIPQTLEEWDTVKTAAANIDNSQLNGPRALMRVISKLKEKAGDFCPNIEKLCTTAAVLPVSTAEVERVFSDVNRTVTDIRNRLTVDSTHNLLMIHRNDQYLDFKRTVKNWYSAKPRRIH